MGYGKWIGGVVGFMAMGPLGALAGYAIGALFDKATDAEAQGATGREYYGPTSSGCEDIGQRSVTVSFSPCLSWLRILSGPTGVSCTARWSLCAVSCG